VRLSVRQFFALAEAPSSGVGRSAAARWLAVIGYAAVLAIVVLWTWRALHDPRAFDTGLAWQAGRLGWATGHPERLSTWNGMTFLAGGMAVASRLWSAHHTAEVVTIVNAVLTIVGLVLTMGRARRVLRPVPWWVATLGLISYVPLMSSVWWKQFNIMALTLAAAGFVLARRGRTGGAAFALGLSVSIKPLAFMIPVVMLVRRDTRRVGLLAIAWIVLLNVLAQALFALRAHDLATLDPTIGLRNLIHKTTAAGNYFLCSSTNFSPTSTLCRLNGGFAHWTLQRLLVLGLIALLGLLVVGALRGRAALSWEVFAFACPFSIMLSALAWAHYQVMLLPLFLLLFTRFVTEGARPGEWAALVVAFVLASLMWDPYGTLVSTLQGDGQASLASTTFLEQYSQLAQYVVIITGVVWYSRHSAVGSPRPASE
jgi:hypothetical protein